MDRTAEFRSFLKSSGDDKSRENGCAGQDKFYETLYNSIAEVAEQAPLAGSYRSLLALEGRVEDLRTKTNLLLDAIKIEGPKDTQMHFEGVKHIISSAVVRAVKTVASAKSKAAGAEIDLVPEQPKTFKNPRNPDPETGYGEPSKVAHEKPQENQVLEQENREIVESTQYETTRQRLLKIEAVQKAIQENLVLQDERIDSICTATDTTGKAYHDLKADGGFGRGSMIRRALFIVILCFTCVLVFLHLYYR